MSKSKRASSGGGKLQPGSPADPAPFGKYYLLGLIARGGMAEVYRARLREHEGEQPLLAIKVMRPQLARETRFVDMFNREGQLAMLLRHDSIVRTIEIGQIEGRHFITMEYIGGRDLTQLLRRCQETNKRIPVPHAVFIAAHIAKGLDFAHNLVGTDGRPLNIVNRDVSPSNVRLSYDGEVKLLDFGIAQALMKFTSEIGVLKGKFSYMSPEQIRGMPLDARTDIFSAGIILHEMLTTEKLFRGDTEFALMEKVRKADIPPPSKFNRRVNADLDKIVLKCLARDVTDRYQSGTALADALNDLLVGYRFDPKELRQLMQQMFRKEYTKEAGEVSAALSAMPLGEELDSSPTTDSSGTDGSGSSADANASGTSGSGSATSPRTGSSGTGVPIPGGPSGASDHAGSAAASSDRAAHGSNGKSGGQAATKNASDKRGFWSRLGFGRK